MSDQKVILRAAQSGAILKGTPGNVLTAQPDGTWRGEPVSAPPSARPCAWVVPPNDEDSGNAPFFNVAVIGHCVEANPASAGFAKSGSSEFALFGSTPKLVYTGPDCTALVRLIAAFSVPATLGFRYGMAVSLSGDMVGADIQTFAFLSKGGQVFDNNGADAVIQPLACERLVALVSGATLDVVAAGATVGLLQTQSYSMAVQVVG